MMQVILPNPTLFKHQAMHKLRPLDGTSTKQIDKNLNCVWFAEFYFLLKMKKL